MPKEKQNMTKAKNVICKGCAAKSVFTRVGCMIGSSISMCGEGCPDGRTCPDKNAPHLFGQCIKCNPSLRQFHANIEKSQKERKQQEREASRAVSGMRAA